MPPEMLGRKPFQGQVLDAHVVDVVGGQPDGDALELRAKVPAGVQLAPKFYLPGGPRLLSERQPPGVDRQDQRAPLHVQLGVPRADRAPAPAS